MRGQTEGRERKRGDLLSLRCIWGSIGVLQTAKVYLRKRLGGYTEAQQRGMKRMKKTERVARGGGRGEGGGRGGGRHTGGEGGGEQEEEEEAVAGTNKGRFSEEGRGGQCYKQAKLGGILVTVDLLGGMMVGGHQIGVGWGKVGIRKQ